MDTQLDTSQLPNLPVISRKRFADLVGVTEDVVAGWINVTCHESTFSWGGGFVTDEQLIIEVSRVCEAIFGFGITSNTPVSIAD